MAIDNVTELDRDILEEFRQLTDANKGIILDSLVASLFEQAKISFGRRSDSEVNP